jgi:hypothetical protein
MPACHGSLNHSILETPMRGEWLDKVPKTDDEVKHFIEDCYTDETIKKSAHGIYTCCRMMGAMQEDSYLYMLLCLVGKKDDPNFVELKNRIFGHVEIEPEAESEMIKVLGVPND